MSDHASAFPNACNAAGARAAVDLPETRRADD